MNSITRGRRLLPLVASLRSRGARRGAVVCALFPVLLGLAGCSDVFGSGGATVVAEVALVNEDVGEFLLANRSGAGADQMILGRAEAQVVHFRLRGENGVPLENPGAYSVSVRFANPQIVSWTSTDDLSGVFTGQGVGYTTFRVEVSRDGEVVFTTGRIGLTMY